MCSNLKSATNVVASLPQLSRQWSSARANDCVRRGPSVSADRSRTHIASIRRQIAAGTYETQWRLDAALDRLLEYITQTR
jgi:hypothetical protein